MCVRFIQSTLMSKMTQGAMRCMEGARSMETRTLNLTATLVRMRSMCACLSMCVGACVCSSVCVRVRLCVCACVCGGGWFCCAVFRWVFWVFWVRLVGGIYDYLRLSNPLLLVC